MLKKLVAAVAAVIIFTTALAAPASAGGPEVETGTPAPPAAPGYDIVTGVPGPSGPQGPRGPQGPAGRPPTQAEIQSAVEAFYLSQWGSELPAGYKPVLEMAVKQGYVEGYPAPGGGRDYRWRRPATRDEVTLIVMRVVKDLKGQLDSLRGAHNRLVLRVNGLEGRVEAVEAVNARQDREISGLWNALDGRTIALVFLCLSVGLAAAAFGLLAAIAAANHD